MAVPYLRWLSVILPPRKTGFDARRVHVEFVLDTASVGQAVSEYFMFLRQLNDRMITTFH
jgi:hypothetical protein